MFRCMFPSSSHPSSCFSRGWGWRGAGLLHLKFGSFEPSRGSQAALRPFPLKDQLERRPPASVTLSWKGLSPAGHTDPFSVGRVVCVFRGLGGGIARCELCLWAGPGVPHTLLRLYRAARGQQTFPDILPSPWPVGTCVNSRE